MAEELIAAGACCGGWWCTTPFSGSGFEGSGAATASCSAHSNWAASALDIFDFIDPRPCYESPPVSISDGPLAFGDTTETWSQVELLGSPALIQAQQDSSIALMDDSSLIDPLVKGEDQIFSVENNTGFKRNLTGKGLSELNNCSTTESSKASANITKEAPRWTAFNTNNIDGSSRCSNQGVAEEKSESEPTLKKPRIETPSQLPTFKVRKEKLGDRITALQQLVSPFGKTDTASVLHEAIDYIKFLHDQVRVLSAPYLKKGPQNQQMKEQEEEDLSSRGLCLVPVAATFAVARSENPLDFWAPFLGGTFR